MKNQYYCIVKENKVVYISTSEKARDKVLQSLEGDYHTNTINTLGVLQ